MVSKRRPTAEERDERIAVPLDAATFIEGVLAVDPDDEDDDTAEK